MRDLSLHILDITENSVRAGAKRVEIRLAEDTAADRLSLEIIDDGQGMDEEMRRHALEPFTTSRTERPVGLGLPLLAQAAREAEGECRVESSPGRGTRVMATFRRGHIDRRPIGDLGETMMMLIVGSPEVDFALEIERDGERRRLDTQEIRASLGGAPLSSAAGLGAVRSRLAEVLEQWNNHTTTRPHDHTTARKGVPPCPSHS